MALAGNLASVIEDKLKNLETPDEVFAAFAEALNSYFSNLEISGTYTGAMSSGSPSGLNGSHIWKVVSPSLSASSMKSSVQGMKDPSSVQSGLASIFKDQLKTITLQTSSSGGVNLDATVKVGCDSITLDFSSKPTQPSATAKVFANGIESAVLSAKPTPSSSSATGSDGSKGTVSFTKQS